MDPVLAGVLSSSLLLVLLTLGVPIGFGMGCAGMVGWFLIGGIVPAMGLSSVVAFARLNMFEYTVIPLFILMGYFVFYAGFGADLYKTCRNWVGHLPGGLALATVSGCAVFAATSGSTIASAATMGRIAVPEMINAGYDKRLAAGCVAAGGTLSAMIPPSILMVLYGIIAETSISKLLIAGILPGLVEVVLYSLCILFWVKKNPGIAPLAPKTTWRMKIVSLKDTWAVILIALIVICGIYFGVFTPTEAGGVGALAAFIVALFSGRLNWGRMKGSFLETARTTGMIFVILIGAFMFGYQFGVSHLPQIFSEFLVGLDVPPLAIICGVCIMYLFLGSFIGSVPMMFLTLPFVLPAVLALGYNPIWFGVIMVHLCETAQITPPFAVNIFSLAGAVPDVSMPDIIRGIGPFLLMDILELVILIAFPQIALFLPSLM